MIDEKEIAEMARELKEASSFSDGLSEALAEAMYKRGWRRQEAVAEEILNEVEEKLLNEEKSEKYKEYWGVCYCDVPHARMHTYAIKQVGELCLWIGRLKKKYIRTVNNSK